jgi:GntR family transcriptional regulator
MNAVSRERSTMGALESFVIDHNSGLPVWIQIKNRIAYLIGSGAFVPGDRLPTVRALAVDLDISYNTVNRAYMDLEREGYISTRKGRGTFVAERHDLGAHTASDSPIELVIDDMIRVCSNAGLADDDIVAMVQARLAHREFMR